MIKSKKLVFFGTEEFSAPSLIRLIAGHYPLAAVVTKPDARSGRGQKLKVPKVVHLAEEAGIKTLQPQKPSEVIPDLKRMEASYGVLVSYGKILPQELIDIFPGGIINVHPSLLPAWRGPSPIEATILSGAKKTGVSLMQLTAEMDAGPVYVQKAVDVALGIDKDFLSTQLAEVGAELLLDKLPAIISGQLRAQPQDDSKASYTQLLRKQDGLIDWKAETAEQIERKVRAYQKFPKTTAQVWGKHEIIITKARLALSPDDGSLVQETKQGYIEILELIAPSGRLVSGSDFIRGYKR